MRSAFGQAQERALAPLAPAPPPAVAPATKEIPYDYAATFTLSGTRAGNRVQDVINISIEGAFVAVAIGYSFIPAQLGQLANITYTTGGGDGDVTVQPTLAKIFADTIANLLTLTPAPTNAANATSAISTELVKIIDPILNPSTLLPLQCLLVKLCGIDFRYSIIDSGTGRELQNLAIHNIAGLGKADGDRPFRPLAKPMLFMPRSTIRIEVEEISEGPLYTRAQLVIVLHGYKLLGYTGTTVP